MSGDAQDITSVGGAWMVRLTMGTKYWIAGEASYFGSAQDLSDNLAGLDNGANLIGNGLQAALRVNLTGGLYDIQPFVYSGGAWRHYDVSGDFNTSDVEDSADVFELPLGVGLAGYWRGLMLDARTEYRWAWGDELLVFSDDSDMDRWNVTGNVGIAF